MGLLILLKISASKLSLLTTCYYLKVQVHMYGWKPISKKKLLHRSDNLLIYRTIDKSTGALMTSQVFFIICSVIRLVKVYAVCRHFEKSPVIQHCQATKVTRRPLFTKAHLSSLLRTFVQYYNRQHAAAASFTDSKRPKSSDKCHFIKRGPHCMNINDILAGNMTGQNMPQWHQTSTTK